MEISKISYWVVTNNELEVPGETTQQSFTLHLTWKNIFFTSLPI